ncbi:MAG: DNA-formamidopyrimidine glycosylase family protein [Woeseiaceae bacterium]|nr:DNA-formamidopyrimidine glycosylase family protein [Woeseiaceae bacterium]
MPELPDIDLYVEKLDERIRGQILKDIRVSKPFLIRSFDPPLTTANGRRVVAIRRVGKRIVFGLEADYWLILHLMIAGRLRWHDAAASIGGRNTLAAFDFDNGCLTLTEAGSQKRASLYLVHGERALAAHDPGGLEPLECSFEEFCARMLEENRTLKRALTSPKTISGIGNAYSDEILHAARLSPIKLTSRLSEEEMRRLFAAVRNTLEHWRNLLREQSRDRFPEKVTAFRDDMAVHGKFGKACPSCGTRVARIRYKSSETNYCPGCQTGGRLLADRSLSRLLKDGWPDSL